jgi:hypothetical protein
MDQWSQIPIMTSRIQAAFKEKLDPDPNTH